MMRRTFLRMSGGVLMAASMPAMGDGRDRAVRKAVKYEMIAGEMSVLEKFQLLKSLGFDGVEMMSPANYDRDEVLAARDRSGIVIHGVVNSEHWRSPLSDPDPAVRARGREALERALRDAGAYGSTTALLVPAVVNKQVSYADAWKRSRAEIRRVLPLAEEVRVRIAIENVWNNFLLSPLEAARYIDEFESPWIGWYFDVGNVVRYGWPDQWIRILDRRVFKLDIKEYSRVKRDNEGLWKGFNVEIGDGDCDWPAVRAALRDIGYEGWATAEVRGGDAARLKEIAERMDGALGL
ncbi:MAG: sugar phosphate isomerase/epimerase family protein [Planctomycetota bacterium]